LEEVSPLLWCYLFVVMATRCFFSALKPLKWLAKFKEWKYRSQVTNYTKKFHQLSWKFFFEHMSSADSLTLWRKQTGQCFFLSLRLSLRRTQRSCKAAGTSVLRENFLPVHQAAAVGAQPFPPSPTSSASAPAQRTRVIRIKSCGFCGLINPWFYPETQRKAIWAMLVAICTLVFAYAIEWAQPSAENSFDCYQSSIRERFSLSVTILWVIQVFCFNKPD